MTGRRMVRSATSASIIASVLSHPNRRNEGRSEKTVTMSPQDSTTDVKIRRWADQNGGALNAFAGVVARPFFQAHKIDCFCLS